MDAVRFARQQVAEAYGLSDAAIAGVTDEQFNWSPPGSIHPVKSALLHAIAGEDVFLQSILQGKLPLSATGGWPETIGLALPPGGGQGWELANATVLALAPVLAYGAAVRAATTDYLAHLSDEELDRPVDIFGSESTVAAALARLATHIAGHAGEVAAVKGMQGLLGLPF
jgi:hypothetical protein